MFTRCILFPSSLFLNPTFIILIPEVLCSNLCNKCTNPSSSLMDLLTSLWSIGGFGKRPSHYASIYGTITVRHNQTTGDKLALVCFSMDVNTTSNTLACSINHAGKTPSSHWLHPLWGFGSAVNKMGELSIECNLWLIIIWYYYQANTFADETLNCPQASSCLRRGSSTAQLS